MWGEVFHFSKDFCISEDKTLAYVRLVELVRSLLNSTGFLVLLLLLLILYQLIHNRKLLFALMWSIILVISSLSSS